MNKSFSTCRKAYAVGLVAACPFPTSQGSQVFIRQLAESLHERGHSPHIVTYHISERGAGDIAVPVHRIPRLIPYTQLRAGPSWRKPFLDLLLVVTLLRVVKRHKIDIIHAHNFEAALAGIVVRVLTGVPVLFHTHSVMSDELPTYFTGRWGRRLAGQAARVIDRMTARHVDRIIAITPEVQAFFVSRGVPQSKITYIPPGIRYTGCAGRQEGKVRAEYGLGSGPLILYAGNLDRYQNLTFLLDSFERVRAEVPEARLVVATHTENGTLDSYRSGGCGIDNVVVVAGCSFSLVRHLLHEAAIAVLPRTSWSGFPIKLLNYMAAGKPVVACSGSGKEIDHLRDGMVVDDGDVEGFARAVTRLLRDAPLRDRLGAAAREKMRSRFAWDTITGSVEKLYGEMTGQPVKPRL